MASYIMLISTICTHTIYIIYMIYYISQCSAVEWYKNSVLCQQVYHSSVHYLVHIHTGTDTIRTPCLSRRVCDDRQ